MKKVSIAAVFLTLALSLSGCLNDDGANFYYTTLPIESVETPDTLVYGETDSITVTYSIPNLCHQFAGIDFSNDTQSSDTIQKRTFWVVAQAQTGDECEGAQSVIKEYKFGLEVRYRESYELRFITGVDSDGEYTFITRTIPVKEEEEE
ncbi:hypothetical protein ED312_01885 [Sinomicrobium pectinilyticum]|uniref:Lipoprotein n=1 Tax=Sinomicrobium pectinilyticum TaxID=1084421 RepID=A0A3N0F1D3_SINP1|nr:hypothetical protein [Sinomicrobium pectinilyticum]RNL93963.1 hypothetical protein ED312_01885 [Sinomicrobium pectinilyticum]